MLRNAAAGGDGRDATGRSYLVLHARCDHARLVPALLTTLGKFASAVQIVTEFEERKRGEI